MNPVLAPIALFVYNRPDHTRRTLNALKGNFLASESILYIFSDGPKNAEDVLLVNEVREIIKHISGFKFIKLIRQKENYGLSRSIISGVSQILESHENIIVVEDDLITDRYFLKFLNSALVEYHDVKEIFAISGFAPITTADAVHKEDVLLLSISSSWGWATWKEEWESIVWDNVYYEDLILRNDPRLEKFQSTVGENRLRMLERQVRGEIDSWAIRRLFSQFEQEKYTLFPRWTLVYNIGKDGSGTHTGYRGKKQETIKLKNTDLRLSKSPTFDEDYQNKVISLNKTPNIMIRLIRYLIKNTIIK